MSPCPRPVGLVALLAVAVLLLAGCSAPPPARDPALPPGFLEAPLPDVPVSSYLYVAPEVPFLLPAPRLLWPGEHVSLPIDVPSELPVRRAQLFVGPTPQELVAVLDLGVEASAAAVSQRIHDRGEPGVDAWHQGPLLVVLRGQGPWTQDASDALRQGRTVDLRQAYPEQWELMRRLPDEPAGSPVAAGFLAVEAELVRAVGRHTEDALTALGDALQFMEMDAAAVALYARRPITYPKEGPLGVDFVEDYDLSAAMVTRASLPGFVVGLAFDAVAGQAGLEKVSLGDHEVHYLSLEGRLFLVVKDRANMLLFVAAPRQEDAIATMRNALGPP